MIYWIKRWIIKKSFHFSNIHKNTLYKMRYQTFQKIISSNQLNFHVIKSRLNFFSQLFIQNKMIYTLTKGWSHSLLTKLWKSKIIAGLILLDHLYSNYPTRLNCTSAYSFLSFSFQRFYLADYKASSCLKKTEYLLHER